AGPLEWPILSVGSKLACLLLYTCDGSLDRSAQDKVILCLTNMEILVKMRTILQKRMIPSNR
ncbi:MAG: hypothetical protein COX51_00465, partial [Syntrophobacteraceae bacterium CG23_combo_of_CG06-09_8_20_14_all_50_8]